MPESEGLARGKSRERKGKKKSGSEHMWESFLSVIFTKMLAKEGKILK